MKSWIAVLLCASFLGCSPQQPAAPPTRPSAALSAPRVEDPLEKSLRHTVDRLLEAIRTGDTREFLALCSRKGIGIGPDGETSYDVLQRDFRTRKSSYCHYFDTACLQEALRKIRYKPPEDIHGALPLPVSYCEVLNRISSPEISVRIGREPEPVGIYGVVTVKWKSPRPRDLGLTGFLDFGFVLEKGEWRLSGDMFP